eukprot:1647003-Rhodomonas_salina.1
MSDKSAMRCPVLTTRCCYEMSGADIAIMLLEYTVLTQGGSALIGEVQYYASVCGATGVSGGIRYCASVWWYVVMCYTVSGTEIAYGGTIGSYGCGLYCGLLAGEPAICLCACFVMSGTHVAHGTSYLRARYAMSGTDLVYGTSSYALALRCSVPTAMSGTNLAYGAVGLRACYAMSGTDLLYGAMSLRACYHQCYAMSGTDLVYGATRSRCQQRAQRQAWYKLHGDCGNQILAAAIVQQNCTQIVGIQYKATAIVGQTVEIVGGRHRQRQFGHDLYGGCGRCGFSSWSATAQGAFTLSHATLAIRVT